MSVRRLAAVQPDSFAFQPETLKEARRWMDNYPAGKQQSAVIPILWLVQKQEGWVSEPAIRAVAELLGMAQIRVLEVATFYTMFMLEPVGTHALVQVCGTTPCQLMGSEKLMDVCRSKIHPEQHHCNSSGTLSWEEVECLGACVNAPMIMVFKDTYEDLTPERLAEIIDEFEAGRGEQVPTGPQTDRFFSAPASGFTSLSDETAVLKTTRDAAAKAAAAAAPAVDVAPSEAARPKTDAIETNPAVKSPSPVKANPAAEAAASVAAPATNKAEANKSVTGEQRADADKPAEDAGKKSV